MGCALEVGVGVAVEEMEEEDKKEEEEVGRGVEEGGLEEEMKEVREEGEVERGSPQLWGKTTSWNCLH